MPGYGKVYLEDGQEIQRPDLTCSYCHLLLKDPLQTSGTGQRYCKECFKEAVRFSFLSAYIINTVC